MKIGVIGAGQIVEDGHLPAIVGRRDVEVVWITDIDDNRRERLARMFKVGTVPIDSAVDRIKGVDFCLIAIPYGARPQYLDACADAGVATYVEKPLARTQAEHAALVERFPPHKLAVGFQRRFYRSVAQLRSLIDSDIFGPPRSATVRFENYSMKSGGGRYITNAKIAGGGIVIEVGIHFLDIMVTLFNPTAVTTFGVNALGEHGIDYHSESHHELVCSFGVLPVNCHFSLLRSAENAILIEFDSCLASIGMQPDDPILIRSKKDLRSFELNCTKTPPGYLATSAAEAFASAWDAIIHGVISRTDHELSAAKSTMTTLWVEEIYKGMQFV